MSYYNTNYTEAAAGCLFGILVFFAIILICSLPVMWLWNWLMPDLFGLPTITWVQALGLNLLCGFLFKGTSVNTKS